MFCHQLLVVLVLVHATASSSPLIVNVSDKGTDSSSCLQNNTTQACRTFEFVLKQLSSPLESDVILVNILDNQSLNGSLFYILNSPFTLVVTGVGYPSITFGKDALSLNGNSSSNVTWRGLVFNGNGLFHQNVRSVTIDDCKLRLSVDMSFVQNVIINNSDIGTPNGICSPIIVNAHDDDDDIDGDDCSLENLPSVVFSSNNVRNCQIPSLAIIFSSSDFCNVTIIDNVFTHLNLTSAYRLMFFRGNIMSLIFQNNSFVENIIGPRIEFDISGSNGQIIVQQNSFLHNIIATSSANYRTNLLL